MTGSERRFLRFPVNHRHWSRQMNILFLATYFPTPTNPARGNWAMEQALAFKQAGHNIKVVVPTPFIPKIFNVLGPRARRQTNIPSKWEVDGLEIYYPRWPYYPWHGLMQKLNRLFLCPLIDFSGCFISRFLDKTIESFKPDVVYAHHTLVCGQLSWSIKKRHGIPYIVTDHEIGDFTEGALRSSTRGALKRAGREALSLVVVSDAMGREAKLVIPEIPTKVIYNGSSFPPLAREECNQSPKANLTIFCCCKLYTRKDVPLLLDAFDQIAGEFPNARLRIAGDGPDRLMIEERIRLSINHERIEMLGSLPPDKIRIEMGIADIFALVGWAEPFGVVFLEAMACGLPVIVSRDAGVAEILTDGETALFTLPRDVESVVDALRRLLSSFELRERLRASALRIYIEKFQWLSVIKEYESLMVDVVGKSQRAKV